MVADRPEVANPVLAQARLDLAERFELIDPAAEEFCWITEWPMFGWNEDEERWDPHHHPFTSPRGSSTRAPGRGQGARLRRGLERPGAGGGSIRISDPDSSNECWRRSGSTPRRRTTGSASCSRRRCGAPPHGGIAYGLDRWVQRLLHADSIRDTIAFPKTASGPIL